MESRWIGRIEDFRRISADWDEALRLSGEENPFLSSDFVITWWKHYALDRKLMVFVLYEGGKTIAGIPLCIEKRSFRKTLVHVGGPAANVTHFFMTKQEPSFMDSLLSSLEKRGGWDVLRLDRILSNKKFIDCIKEPRYSGFGGLRSYIFEAGHNGMINLEEGYEAVIKNVSKRLKRYLKKSKRIAEEMGGLKLHEVKGKSDVIQLFKEYQRLSIESFKERGNVSVFKDSKKSDFFGELLVRFEEKGMLDAHSLTAGKYLLGISFGYRFGKGYKWILTAFNPHFWELRPGHLLIDALVRKAIERKDPYFDMYYGADTFYKRQWCNATIPLVRLEVCRNNLLNRSLSVAENAIRSNEFIMGVARKIKRSIRRYF